jgi:hypothetical protein
VPVRELFHLMHVVDDFDAAQSWLDELLRPVTHAPKHWSDFDKRWASLNRVGDDLIYELMEPSKAADDAGAPIPKFQSRFGEHLHSLAWYVDAADMGPLFDKLRGAGIRVAKPGGGLFGQEEVIEPPPNLIFTHPRDTFGQVELMGIPPEGNSGDPLWSDDWSTAPWRDEHPARLRRSRYTVSVADIDDGLGFFEGMLGGHRFLDESSDDRVSTYVFVGNQTVVELAKPTRDGTLLADDLAANGQLLHGLTLEVADLDGAERHVEKMGLRVGDRADRAFTIDPADAFQAVITFTDRTLPGDPRD